MIIESIERAGYNPGIDISLCLDVASNELFDGKNYSIISGKKINSKELINYYADLVKKYPIKSIEDPIFEDDWEVWSNLTGSIGDSVQIVGDDLFVTNENELTGKSPSSNESTCSKVKLQSLANCFTFSTEPSRSFPKRPNGIFMV